MKKGVFIYKGVFLYQCRYFFKKRKKKIKSVFFLKPPPFVPGRAGQRDPAPAVAPPRRPRGPGAGGTDGIGGEPFWLENRRGVSYWSGCIGTCPSCATVAVTVFPSSYISNSVKYLIVCKCAALCSQERKKSIKYYFI